MKFGRKFLHNKEALEVEQPGGKGDPDLCIGGLTMKIMDCQTRSPSLQRCHRGNKAVAHLLLWLLEYRRKSKKISCV